MTSHDEWMRLAIEQARAGLAAGQSPFGAVIVRADEWIASAHNEVWKRCDPTAHAEVVAIQRAAKALQRIDLSGCTLYTTCEPCPMCAAATHWARIDAVYCGASIADAQRGGFSELTLAARDLYQRGASRVRLVDGILTKECAALFDDWLAKADRRPY